MLTTHLVTLLQVAGLLHLGLVWAGASMPRAVNLGAHLATLPEFIRRLVWVYYTFIGFCLIGFGSFTFFFADILASGVPLARAVCGFLCGFWTIRFLVAAFVFDLRPYLTTPWRRAGYHTMNMVFALLPLIYAAAALKGVHL